MFGKRGENIKQMKKNRKLILSEADEDFLAKATVLPFKIDDIMAEFNAFDWLDLSSKPIEEIAEDFKERLNFKSTEPIHLKAFAHKFGEAIKYLNKLIEEIHSSYNIPGKGCINNSAINQYYYIKLWADKKCLPVDYNETDYNKRRLFNFYTILFDIFADKLTNYNAYNAQKK